MILESNLTDNSLLQIEVASDGGINKGGGSRQGHPDRIVENILLVVDVVRAELLEKIRDSGVRGAEVEFGLRIDAGANVFIAMTPSDGQVRIKMTV